MYIYLAMGRAVVWCVGVCHVGLWRGYARGGQCYIFFYICFESARGLSERVCVCVEVAREKMFYCQYCIIVV